MTRTENDNLSSIQYTQTPLEAFEVKNFTRVTTSTIKLTEIQVNSDVEGDNHDTSSLPARTLRGDTPYPSLSTTQKLTHLQDEHYAFNETTSSSPDDFKLSYETKVFDDSGDMKTNGWVKGEDEDMVLEEADTDYQMSGESE